MYEFEEVPEEEGVALAKQIGAIFQSTTAKDQNGSIDKLFQNIGRKFLHPNSDVNTNSSNDKNKDMNFKKDFFEIVWFLKKKLLFFHTKSFINILFKEKYIQ